MDLFHRVIASAVGEFLVKWISLLVVVYVALLAGVLLAQCLSFLFPSVLEYNEDNLLVILVYPAMVFYGLFQLWGIIFYPIIFCIAVQWVMENNFLWSRLLWIFLIQSLEVCRLMLS